MPRSTKFSDEKAAIILDRIEKHCFLKVAAQCAGVNQSTLHRWLEKGRSRDPKYAKFRAFRNALRRARSNAEAELVHEIRQDKTWTAKAWILERSYRSRWGQSTKIDASIGGKKGQPVQMQDMTFPPEFVAEVISILHVHAPEQLRECLGTAALVPPQAVPEAGSVPQPNGS